MYSILLAVAALCATGLAAPQGRGYPGNPGNPGNPWSRPGPPAGASSTPATSSSTTTSFTTTTNSPTTTSTTDATTSTEATTSYGEATSTGATTSTATAPSSTSGGGGGHIQFSSGCSQTVYYEVFVNTIGQVSSGSISTSGQPVQIPYGADSNGLVIKTSFNQNPSSSGAILQLEVDQDLTKNLINYDISAVNGDPFKAYGSSIYVDSPSSGCDNIQCPAGDDSCAFQFPDDNSKDHGCSGTDHIVYAQVCSVV